LQGKLLVKFRRARAHDFDIVARCHLEMAISSY
jgi:hypothetical protein